MTAPKRGRPAARPSASTRAMSPRAGRRPATTARRPHRQPATPVTQVTQPWNALWAMMVGFFMILVDSTIVAVANPSIMEKLGTDYDAVIWVTSAYLLAYAVPLLVAGRLGDQFGPKNLYLIGLFVFTASSLWCGLAGSVEILITARVVQGVGAALLTPQTLSTITRIFPAERRGVAMSVWGATAGVATLVGPLAGGVLVDHLGWQWIFFVNVPIGVVGLVLAYRLIPVLPTHRHRFDIPGVLLSGTAMFLIVFALQEGESRGWPLWIWLLILGGLVIGAVFLRWQAVNTHEPLIPLRVFRDRDFSLSNLGVAVIGFSVTAMIVPVMFYAQLVCGLSPTRSALLTAPMAVISGVLAPMVGKMIDRVHPTPVVGFGFSMLAVGLTWLSWEMTAATPIWRLLLPFVALGVGNAFIWAPLATTATRNLPPDLAGAGSGVYNTTRQVGSVLGSAGIAAFMTSRIGAEVPGGNARPPAGAAMVLPDFLRQPFAAALSQSMLLPAFVALFGVIAALFMVGMVKPGAAAAVRRSRRGSGRAGRPDDRVSAALNASTEILPRFTGDPFDSRIDESDWQQNVFAGIDYADDAPGVGRHPEGYVDDDEDGYVEYLISVPAEPDIDDGDTEPLAVAPHPVHAPAEPWYSGPDEPTPGRPAWRALFDDEPVDHGADDAAELVAEPLDEPIGFAHNGFHVDDNQRFQPLPPRVATAERVADGFDRLADRIETFSASFSDLPGWPEHGDFGEPPGRHGRSEQPEHRTGRHYREDPDDGPGYGRHAMPNGD